MWDLPGPGIKPVSPELAGRFSTTAPPGKSCIDLQFLFFLEALWRVEWDGEIEEARSGEGCQ